MILIHHVFIKYGFLSSQTDPPNFRVVNYNNHNESIPIHYWHPYKNYVIHIKNEGKPEEYYMVFDKDGRVIKELYNPYDTTYFFDYDTEFNNSQVSPAPVNNYPSQNPPQYNSSNSVQVLPPAPVSSYPSQNSQKQPLHYRSIIQNTPNYYSQPQYTQLRFDINHFLNAMPSKNYLNLESIIPSSHIIHRMASYLHKEFPLPMSTLILVGLGVASGITARKWNCAYQKRGTAPICLYVVAEQKPGKGKTTALKILQEPLRNSINERVKKLEAIIQTQEENLKSHLTKEADDLSKEYQASFKLQTKQLTKELNSVKDKLKNTKALLPKKEVTPEALEESLNNTNGFFLAASDEQTLIDSLISSKGKSKSNGILLAGRNGEEYNSEFRTRQGYQGIVTGSFICFSQYGCIDKIMAYSGRTGLCERFLMMSEPELPERFYQGELQNSNYQVIDDNSQALFDEYASKFDFLKYLIEKPLDYDELITLKISNNGWHYIKLFENKLKENKLNGYLSNDILSVMASKADTQIMSIASNLYLLDLDRTTQPSTNGDHCIPDNYIDIAINVFRELIVGFRGYCEANGIIGNKEQIEAIMNCFYDKNKNQYVSLNQEQMKHKCEQLKVFKNLKNKRQLIVELVNSLNQNNIILFDNGMYYINPLTQQPSHMMVNRNI
jgi:hypothetical protein